MPTYKWAVMMTHGIAAGFDAMSDPEVFHTHLQYVKTRMDQIWVDTFANVSRYQMERDDAKLSLTPQPSGATCAIAGTLDPQRFDVPLTIVIDRPGVSSATAERVGQPLPVRVGKDSIYIKATPSTQPISIIWK